MLQKLLTLGVLTLAFSFTGSSQQLSSQTLLNKLHPFWEAIEEIREEVTEKKGVHYVSLLEQSYDFITLILQDSSGQLFLEIKYQLKSQNMLVQTNFYCADEELRKKVLAKAKKMEGKFDWNNPAKTTFNLSSDQILYLQIADRIASKGNDISARPSDYGRLLLSSKWIKLTQSNHWNSKSLDHKDSYYMRDLSILIPLEKVAESDPNPISIDLYQIGAMQVHFVDGSAKSSRGTGDEILAQIKKEMEDFKMNLKDSK